MLLDQFGRKPIKAVRTKEAKKRGRPKGGKSNKVVLQEVRQEVVVKPIDDPIVEMYVYLIQGLARQELLLMAEYLLVMLRVRQSTANEILWMIQQSQKQERRVQMGTNHGTYNLGEFSGKIDA